MGRRSISAFLIAALLVVLLPTAASARWTRARSTPEFFGDDISVCADEITLKSEIRESTTYYLENVGAGVPPEPNTTAFSDVYGYTETIHLYGSAADALANDPATAVSTYLFDPIYRRIEGTRYVFEQEVTLPTPAGYGDGDMVYAYVEPGTPEAALTIGDAAYGCESTAEPAELNLNVWTYNSRIWVGSWWPYVIAFDRADVDTSTLQIQADNGTVTTPNYIGDWSTRSFAKFYPNQAGVNCDSTKLILTATSTSGQPMQGEYNINPVGWYCGW